MKKSQPAKLQLVTITVAYNKREKAFSSTLAYTCDGYEPINAKGVKELAIFHVGEGFSNNLVELIQATDALKAIHPNRRAAITVEFVMHSQYVEKAFNAKKLTANKEEVLALRKLAAQFKEVLFV